MFIESNNKILGQLVITTQFLVGGVLCTDKNGKCGCRPFLKVSYHNLLAFYFSQGHTSH